MDVLIARYWQAVQQADPTDRIELAYRLLEQCVPLDSEAGYSVLCVLLNDANDIGIVIARIEDVLVPRFANMAPTLLPLLGHAYQRAYDLRVASLIFFVCERLGFLQGKNDWARDIASEVYSGLAENLFFQQYDGSNYPSASLRARLLFELFFQVNRPAAAAIDASGKTQARGPDFIIAGSAKCGTTYLYDLITRLPGVWSRRPKETHFFTNYHDFGTAFYARYFADCPDHLLCGEASPDYLDICNPALANYQDVALRIWDAWPKTRIIIILRDPVARALSLYGQMMTNENSKGPTPDRQSMEQLTLADMLAYRGGYVLESGKYVHGLRKFAALFGKSRLLLLNFAELAEPLALAGRLGQFLDLNLPPSFAAQLDWHRIDTNAGSRSAVAPELRAQLQQYYAESLAQLADEFRIELRHA